MATRTSVKSGLWSAADTWDTGVPVNGDTVVIAAGHNVIYDVVIPNCTPIASSADYLTAPSDLLREMIARSAAFQTAIGATGTAEQKVNTALGKIYITAIDDFSSGSITRPFCLVEDPEEWEMEIRDNTLVDAGQIRATFEASVASANADDPEAAGRAFKGVLQNIIADVIAQCGADYQNGYTYPVYDRTYLRSTPMRSDALQGEAADYYVGLMGFSYKS